MVIPSDIFSFLIHLICHLLFCVDDFTLLLVLDWLRLDIVGAAFLRTSLDKQTPQTGRPIIQAYGSSGFYSISQLFFRTKYTATKVNVYFRHVYLEIIDLHWPTICRFLLGRSARFGRHLNVLDPFGLQLIRIIQVFRREGKVDFVWQ